ncbi:MAG: tetratricopeptide repeat protein [Microscillaceae bacterium]
MSKTQKDKNPQAKPHQDKVKSNTQLLETTATSTAKGLDTEKFIRKNRLLLGGALGILLLVVLSIFYYRYTMQAAEAQAQEEMFPAVTFIESDSVKLAYEGNDAFPGFKEIQADYAGTKAANLAAFYAGVALMKQEKFKEAIPQLEKFSSRDLLLQARAYALIGDCHSEMAQYAKAQEYYKKASEYKPNDQFTPRYLIKLALVLEKQNKNQEAIKVYDQIIEKHFKANNELTEAKKYKARLAQLSQK